MRCHTPGMGLMSQLVSGTEWSHFTDYLSPTLFDVLPGRELRRVLGALSGSALRRGRFDAAKAARAELLDAHGVPVRLAGAPDASAHTSTRDLDVALGDAVLELYFHQLYVGDRTLLDLRSQSFEPAAGPATWRPSALVFEWSSDFIEPLRALYRGFYDGDDAMFDEALRDLSLTPARDVFLSHFGGGGAEGDQHAVAFDMATFHGTFHEAFVACRDAGTHLHGDFVALGLYLATLYEHLEQLGGSWDVRAAFVRATEQT